ncbi:hypothetical protein [Aquibium sp. ELW1220]|uniref:NACHT domain-containing protein n=1 Tax=Aquibium sp. ELW1220 TaxID=2976766 RepID=UPI0025B0176D|nr:hypothetical protein [Aquibium sp. ELW1220]MDN2582930.1 hypothetical protein [Aquibium sp. ELW1220]
MFIDLPIESFPFPFIHVEYIEGNIESIPQEFSADAQWDEEPEDDLSHIPPGCVKSLLERAADKLDPDAVGSKPRRQPYVNRIVVLGGPGQGKSTLGQFIAQVSRATLLKTISSGKLSPETVAMADHILDRASYLGIPLQGPARLPFRLDLTGLADAINASERRSLSLIRFIAMRMSRDLETPIDADAVRKLLTQFPWLLILDGLDEVPPSANRKEVLSAIEGFWDEVHSANADVLAVVTTRPQGYNHDLDPKMWQHWHLAPLPPEVAIQYAEKLGLARLADPERRKSILNDIAKACLDPATRLLTTSPLQVAILFGISFLKGNIPQDRWELFDKYYNLLRDREAQKPGETASFVRDNKRIIDAIHQDCGWLLQVEAESAGRTAAFLTETQFREIIEDLLLSEGYEKPRSEELAGEFARIATERLVLLATQVEGRLSFDVRSLQEYMAAAKLAGADQKLFDARLRAIAGSAHWRHVFRIAASKAFSVVELGHLRTTVVAVCDALDRGDIEEASSTVRAGAALALDLLADGVATSAPKFERQFAVRALEMLNAGSGGFDPRLADIASLGYEELLARVISAHVNSDNVHRAQVAWRLLSTIAQKHYWAEKLMLELLPADCQKRLNLVASVSPRFWPASLKAPLLEAQETIGPAGTSRFYQSIRIRDRDQDQDESIDEFVLMPELHRRSNFSHGGRIISCRWFCGVQSSITPYRPTDDVSKIVPDGLKCPPWSGLVVLRNFAIDATPYGLAKAIEQYSNIEKSGEIKWPMRNYLFPWVLSCLIADYHEGHSGSELAYRARNGGFGTNVDWDAAETRWRSDPIKPDDLLTWEEGLYLGSMIATKGVPIIGPVTGSRSNVSVDVSAFSDVLERMPSGEKLRRILWLMIASARRSTDSHAIERALELYFRYVPSVDAEPIHPGIFALHAASWNDARIVLLADAAGRKGSYPQASIDLEAMMAAFQVDPSKRGLIVVLAGNISHLRRVKRDLLHIPEEALQTIPGDEPAVCAAVAWLRILTLRWGVDDAEQIARDLSRHVAFCRIAIQFLRSEVPEKYSARMRLLHALAVEQLKSGGTLDPLLFEVLNADVGGYPTRLARLIHDGVFARLADVA